MKMVSKRQGTTKRRIRGHLLFNEKVGRRGWGGM
jgi:hypothetical protein